MLLESFRECGEPTRFKTLQLRDFRNYESLKIEFGDTVNLIIGPNAQGKSNLLEALSVISVTRSFRGAKDRSMVRSGCEVALVGSETEAGEVSIRIPRQGRRSAAIGGSAIPRVQDLIGRLPTISFSSSDIELITGEPSARRRFLDLELSQLSPKYLVAFSDYRRALDQRNALLKQIREGWEEPATLDVWDHKLAVAGALMRLHRRAFVESLSSLAATRHGDLSGIEERLTVRYASQDESETEAELRQKLEEKRKTDIVIGSTSVGPHRDDLVIEIESLGASAFGSQGQQRTALLAIKLAQVDYWRAREGRIPALLLDDILSDLDAARRRQVLSVSGSLGQVFVTATDLQSVSDSVSGSASIFNISQGKVSGA